MVGSLLPRPCNHMKQPQPLRWRATANGVRPLSSPHLERYAAGQYRPVIKKARQYQAGTPNHKGGTMKRRTALMIVLTTAIWLGFARLLSRSRNRVKEQTRRNLDVRLIQRQAAGWKPLWGNNPKSSLSHRQCYYTWHVFRSDRPNSRRITACRGRQTKARPRCREALPTLVRTRSTRGTDRHVSR